MLFNNNTQVSVLTVERKMIKKTHMGCKKSRNNHSKIISQKKCVLDLSNYISLQAF